MPKPTPMSADDAETLALSALAFLAEDASRLTRFLALTGLDPSDLRQQADTRYVQCAILEHVAADESLLLVFAASRGEKPDAIARALALLSPQNQRS